MVFFSEDPIRAIQALASPWLTATMIALTEIGSRWILFGLAMLVAYLLDKRTGFFLAIVLLASATSNSILKTAFAMPRPDPALHLAGSSGYGFPSGHAQSSTTFFAAAAWKLRHLWIPLAIVAIPAIAFTRLYLGVHFLGDVLGGAAFGLAAVAIAVVLARAPFWDRLDVRARLLVAFLAPTAVQGVLFLALRQVSTSLGLLTGVALGIVLEARWVNFGRPRGTPAFALRFLLGGACLAALEFLRETIEYAPANYAFLILAGIVATVVLPWIFVRIEARLPRPELPQAPA